MIVLMSVLQALVLFDKESYVWNSISQWFSVRDFP